MALPGVKATIKDRFVMMGRSDLPVGPTLAIIAKRSNASNNTYPDLTPFYATGEQDVIDGYGENSYLHRAYYEAAIAGASRIVLIPLPANSVFSSGTGTISSAGISGDLFALAMDAAQTARADVVVPWTAGSDTTVWDDYSTPATPGGTLTDFFWADSAFAGKLADKCAEITAESHPILGVIGIKGFAGNDFTTPAQTTTGMALASLPNKEAFANGHFISVVAGEVRPVNYPSSWGWASAAVAYAAQMVRSQSHDALTGKPVRNVDLTRYTPTNSQAEALTNKGVVTFGKNSRGGLQWLNAVTFAAEDSDFIRLTTTRVAIAVIKAVISVGENYLGKAMSVEAQNAFDTELTSNFTAMIRVGALNGEDHRIRYDPAANRAYVDVAFTPAFELVEIILTVSVNF
jgi:hypothetical protein